MASNLRRLHDTRDFVRSHARRRRCLSKLADVVPHKNTIHPLATASKLVASFPRNQRCPFTFRQKNHTIHLEKIEISHGISYGSDELKKFGVLPAYLGRN